MTPEPRDTALDALRGVAVLGILAMNIVSFGQPSAAYFAPWVAGLEGPADTMVWALKSWLVDGRMRALFALLFGAGIAMMAERMARPRASQARRMAVLLAIGLLHAWLFWYGDILSYYALIGLFAVGALGWTPRRLLGVGITLLILQSLVHLVSGLHGLSIWAAAEGPGASEAARMTWQEYRLAVVPTLDDAAAEIAAYRGSWADAFAARRAMLIQFYGFILPYSLLLETGGQILTGMALWRMGWWSRVRTAAQVRRRAFHLIAPGFVLLGVFTWLQAQSGWLTPLWFVHEGVRVLAGTAMALGYAVVVLHWARGSGWLVGRVAAVGRMALSNYLAQTLIATTLFHGWGLGLFAALSRAELLLAVAGIWALQLAWSRPWLAAHAHGPVEWLWRWAARGERPRWRLQPSGAVSGPPVRTNHSS